MATKTAERFSDHGFPRPSPAQPLDEADLDSEMGPSFARQISPNCRLVDCKVPSPTCADAPDDTRLEFKDFKRRAQSLALDARTWRGRTGRDDQLTWPLADMEFFCSQDVEGMVASVRGLGCLPFHDELAASLLRASLDQKDATRQAVIPLLIALHNAELMTTAQLARGFEKLVLSWEDLQLDVPGAPGLLVSLLSSRVGLFDKSLFARLPEDLLSKVSCDLPTNLAQRTIQTHLEELRAFKTELHNKIQEHLLRMGTADGLAAWLREECKPAFHHEVVVAACLCSFDGKPSPDAYWTSCFDSGDLRAETLGEAAKQRGALGSSVPEVGSAPGLRRRVWGSGDIRQMRAEMHDTIEELRSKFQDPLEYFDSHSTEELAQVLEELHLSSKEQAPEGGRGGEASGTMGPRHVAQGPWIAGGASTSPQRLATLVIGSVDSQEVEGAFQQIRDIEADLASRR
eukprot:Skav223868  [mRNA]  locus=scaffold1226:182363:193467:- [translate_table: standard]